MNTKETISAGLGVGADGAFQSSSFTTEHRRGDGAGGGLPDRPPTRLTSDALAPQAALWYTDAVRPCVRTLRCRVGTHKNGRTSK